MNDHPSLSEKQNPAYVRMRRTTLGAHGHPPAHVEFTQHMSSQMTPSIASSSDHLHPSDRFAPRHLGPRPEDQKAMLSAARCFFDEATCCLKPSPMPFGTMILCVSVRRLRSRKRRPRLRAMMSKKSCAQECDWCGIPQLPDPSVIERTVFRNPGWYTRTRPTRLRSRKVAWKCCWLGKP